VWLTYHESKVKVQYGSTVIPWVQKEGAERNSHCWEGGRHPNPINGGKGVGVWGMGWTDRIDSHKPRLLQKLVILALHHLYLP